jgi:hypothetical protein
MPNHLLLDPSATMPGLSHLLVLQAAQVAVVPLPVILREPPLKLLQPQGHLVAVAAHLGNSAQVLLEVAAVLRCTVDP